MFIFINILELRKCIIKYNNSDIQTNEIKYNDFDIQTYDFEMTVNLLYFYLEILKFYVCNTYLFFTPLIF